MSNFRTEWNALGKLIGLALQAAAIGVIVYAAVIGLTVLTGF